MYRILIASFMLSSFLFSNDFTLDEKKLFEPNTCDKKYTDCIDECDKKNIQESFPSCLSKCGLTYDECEKKSEEENIQNNCNELYSQCLEKCEKLENQPLYNECTSHCESLYDGCEDKNYDNTK